ncbi:MAG: TraB/GumN family protein [Pseudoxanthomonas sp.]
MRATRLRKFGLSLAALSAIASCGFVVVGHGRALAPAETSGQAAAAGSSSAASARPPVPLLWKVSDADNSVYLLGSFHLLRPDDYPLSKDVDAAFEDAESLLFELPPQDMDSPAMSAKMLQAGIRRDGRTLQDDLDPGTWAALQDYAAKNGLPLAGLSNLEPWLVGLTISIAEMTKQGLDPKLGLDAHFVGAAAAANKPAAGLESGDEQIALLAGMDAADQVQFLAEALDEAAKGSRESARLHAAWRDGNAALLLDEMAAEMKREYPRLYRRINVERNDRWVPKIARLLDDSHDRDTLVVVGTLHLLGSDGVVEKLRAKGYKVERICSVCK